MQRRKYQKPLKGEGDTFDIGLRRAITKGSDSQIPLYNRECFLLVVPNSFRLKWAFGLFLLIQSIMKSEAILYVPSDTPEAMTMATRRVAGVPVIVRGVMTLAQAGIRCCTLLIAAAQHEKITRFLKRYNEKELPEITIINYDEPYRVSPNIVHRIYENMSERCLIINANLLFDKELVEIVRSNHRDAKTTLCYEGVHPLPIVMLSPQIWQELEAFTDSLPRSIESCIKYIYENNPRMSAQKPEMVNAFLIKRHRDREVAEKFLTESIRHSTSGPVARHINKRFSLPLSLILSKLWISPNTITALNIIIGLFSGVFVADGHRYDVILLGAALFQIASIVDGCDGEVAKLTFRCSKFGQYIDSISDNLSLGSFMTGLIAGYWRHTHSLVAFTVGAIMIFSTLTTLFWMIRYLKNNTQSASLVTFDKEYLQKLSNQPKGLMTIIQYGKFLLKKDVFSMMFLLFAIVGSLYTCLFITAFGTTVAAIILTCLHLQPMLLTRKDERGAI